LRIASDSIRARLSTGHSLTIATADYPPELAEQGASFITLKRNGDLRGCIGTPQAYRPLIIDVAENAGASAFEDPRFPQLTNSELTGLDISISVLTAPEPFTTTSHADLLANLRPGRDGIILRDGGSGALFLPQVWEMCPTPAEFITQLNRKAGWPDQYWSSTLQTWRFEALSVGKE
jgi:AmmeMemoRadiSam system protein A